jgi:hypothetical protein
MTDALNNGGAVALAVPVDDATAPPTDSGGSRVRTAPFVAPPLMVELICDAIAQGRSLMDICREINVPDSTVDSWILRDTKFGTRYAYARSKRFDRITEECLTIADDRSQDDIIDHQGFRRPNKEWIARSRVKIDTRLRLLALWDPKKYGAKLELNGDLTTRNLNINVPVDPVQAAHAYADLMRGRPPVDG